MTGSIVTFDDAIPFMPIEKIVASIEPQQDLHGYDAPWPAGGGVNKLNPSQATRVTSSFFGLSIDWNATDGYCRLYGTWNSSATSGGFRAIEVPSEITNLNVKGFESSGHASCRWQSGEDRIVIDLTDMVQDTAYDLKVYPIIYEGSTAPTAWSPYANECPISGHTGVSGQRTGVNLFDAETELGGRGAVEQSDGSWYFETLSNIPADTIIWKCPSGYTGQVTIDYLYKNVNGSGSQGGRFRWVYSDGTSFPIYANVTTEYARITNTSASGKTVVGLAWDYGSSVNSTWFKDFQVELSSTASPYEPYTSKAISVSFGQTVYGGSDEVVSGNGTSTMGMVDLGTLAWSNPVTGIFNANITGLSTAIKNKVRCSVYGYGVKDFSWNSVASYADKTINTSANAYIYIKDTSYSDATTFKNAMNGVQLCYELATPQSFTHEGQSVDTLVGQNNVWVDTGDVTVTYQSTSGSTPVRTSLKSPLKSYSYNALKLFGNTFIEHGKG